MQKILEALWSPEFIRAVFLLIITGGLTGLLVPQLAAALAERRHRKQKLFEAELIRQRDILTSQSELLRSMSNIAWRFQLRNIAVSYYRLLGDDKNYGLACEKYQSEATDLLGQFRAELSTSRRFVSPDMYERLRSLYFSKLLSVDASLESLIRKNGSDIEEWQVQHNRSFDDAQSAIESTLTLLANELQLTTRSAPQDALVRGDRGEPGAGGNSSA